MRKPFYPVIIATLIILSFADLDVYAYGYKKQDDPLIKVFKSVVYHGKLNDWDMISKEIDSINDRISDINNLFGIDLSPKLKDAVDKENMQDMAKNMACLVFLAMREKFYWNTQEELKIYAKSRVRLRLAEEYFVTLLSGNVRVYDAKNKTTVNSEIYQNFAEARKTLGSLGFFGVGSIKPDLDKFVSISADIEQQLVKVFPYFK